MLTDQRLNPDRRSAIVQLLTEHEFMRVTDLAELFGVSAVTVRSDLEALESEQRVRRVRGGAILGNPPASRAPSFHLAMGEATSAKMTVARHAVSLLRSGQNVLLDGGTTGTFLARQIAMAPHLEGLTVVTNGIECARELAPAMPRVSVVLLGGPLLPGRYVTTDQLGAELVDRINADVAFVGCDGISASGGVTGHDLGEAAIRTRLANAAERVIVAADHTKVGKTELYRIAPLSRVDLVLTDAGLPAPAHESLTDAGVTVELAVDD